MKLIFVMTTSSTCTPSEWHNRVQIAYCFVLWCEGGAESAVKWNVHGVLTSNMSNYVKLIYICKVKTRIIMKAPYRVRVRFGIRDNREKLHGNSLVIGS